LSSSATIKALKNTSAWLDMARQQYITGVGCDVIVRVTVKDSSSAAAGADGGQQDQKTASTGKTPRIVDILLSSRRGVIILTGLC
jgi:hypothetical protein